MCLCEWTPLACRGLWKPEEGVGPPGAGELLDMGAGGQAQVFYKSNKLLSAEPSPQPQHFLMQYILIILFPFPQTKKNENRKEYIQ